MMVAGTQLLPSVSTSGLGTVVLQVRWNATVQTPVNYHCQLEEHPIRDVKPMKLVTQYLIQATIELPSAGDNTRVAFSTSCSLSMTVLGAPARTELQ